MQNSAWTTKNWAWEAAISGTGHVSTKLAQNEGGKNL